MWLLALLACGSRPGPAGPTARERFEADPLPVAAPAGERHLGGTPWGVRLEPDGWRRPRPDWRLGSAARPRIVALEGGRWAIGEDALWTLWDPARGRVAEVAANGFPTPDGTWVVTPRGGSARLDRAPIGASRVGWGREGARADEVAWRESGAGSAREVSTQDRRPLAPQVHPPARRGAALVLRNADGRVELPGCTDLGSVSWVPNGSYFACSGEGATVVYDRAGWQRWSAPHATASGTVASLSADGRVLAHLVGAGPCVHHADGGSWASPGLGALAVGVTDDGSLVIAAGDGTAVLDAATGARLDPPRSTPRPVGYAAGPRGEVAAITPEGVLLAWDGEAASLGSVGLGPDVPPARRPAWSTQITWTAAGICATRPGALACVDPHAGWRTTVAREGKGLAFGSHLVTCDPLTVDGLPVPGAACKSSVPIPAGDGRSLVVRQETGGDVLLDLDSGLLSPVPPRANPDAGMPERWPRVWASRGGGVHVVDAPPPPPVAASPPAPPPSATADRIIPLTAALGELLPTWAERAPVRTRNAYIKADEVRFPLAPGMPGVLAVEGATAAVASEHHLVVAAPAGLVVVSLPDGAARLVPGAGDPGDRIAFSADGRQLATTGPGRTRLWDVATLAEVGRRAEVRLVAPSPEGRWAVAVRADGVALLVDLARGTIAPIDGVLVPEDVAFDHPYLRSARGAAVLGAGGALAASRLFPWQEGGARLLLDDAGRAEVAWDGRRYAVDDAGRLTDVGAHVTPYDGPAAPPAKGRELVAAGGDRVAILVGQTFFAYDAEGGPPGCVLPAGPAAQLVMSPSGAYAAWLEPAGLWRADVVACRLLQWPAEIAAPRRAYRDPPGAPVAACRTPMGVVDVLPTHDGGLVAWSPEEIWTYSPATVAGCPPADPRAIGYGGTGGGVVEDVPGGRAGSVYRAGRGRGW